LLLGPYKSSRDTEVNNDSGWSAKSSETVGAWVLMQVERVVKKSSQWPCICYFKLKDAIMQFV